MYAPTIGTIVQTRDELDQLKHCLTSHARYAMDTETYFSHNHDKRKIMGMSWWFPKGTDGQGFYLPMRHRDRWPDFKYPMRNVPSTWIDEVRPLCEKGEPVFHNALFDLDVLQREGIEVSSFFDSLVMAHLCDENRFEYSLDGFGRDLFGIRKIPSKGIEYAVGHWDYIPIEWMGPYAIQDVRITWKLFERAIAGIARQNLEEVWELSKRCIRALVSMVQTGLLVDADGCSQRASDALDRLAELRERYGGVPLTDTWLARTLSEEHAVELIRRSRKTSKPRLDEETLTEYALRQPECKPLVSDVLEYRKLTKYNSTWYSGFPRFFDDSNRIHAGVLLHGTKTGRPSSREPNTLQIPRGDRVKPLFVAPPGYDLYEIDFDQIELKLIAVYCADQAKDDTLLKAYINGVDLHDLTASTLGSYDYFAESKDGRQVGKTCNFLLGYMGGPGMLQATLWRDAQMDVPFKQCEVWYKDWHKLYPGVKRMNERAKRQAIQNGFVKLWTGRRRHFEVAWEARKAFNSVIQGGAAQITLRSLCAIHEDDRIESRPCNTVYDSIWFYIPKHRVDEELRLITEHMTVEYTDMFEIPITVTASRLSSGSTEVRLAA